MPEVITDCIVVGTGPAGLVTALAFVREGLGTLLIGPDFDFRVPDPRTTALFSGSIELLRNLGVWPVLEPEGAPLQGLRLIDDTGALLRAPEILFRADEVGLAAFGYNIANATLNASLWAEVRKRKGLRVLTGQVTGVRSEIGRVVVSVAEGTSHKASLVAGADGRKSVVRAAAGIATNVWAYPQSAIVTTFRHGRPHHGTSTEFHRKSGPLTTVPLAGNASSLVWVEQPEQAHRLSRLPPDAFASELEERLQGLLGTVDEVGSRTAFPLSGMQAARMAQGRIALVGEAAHVLPPIGAQGLNLGFRDAATLAEVAAAAKADVGDAGARSALSAYAARRRPDVLSRTLAVDLLNRSLILDLLPLSLGRSAGLQLISRFPWLRRLTMQEGMQPSLPLPRLMHGPTKVNS